MSRGTDHNAYNRDRQRVREAAEFQRHDPAARARAEAERERARGLADREALDRQRRVKEAAERSKGQLELCSVCREFFRSTSTEVGPCLCLSCRSQAKE